MRLNRNSRAVSRKRSRPDTLRVQPTFHTRRLEREATVCLPAQAKQPPESRNPFSAPHKMRPEPYTCKVSAK